MDRGPGFDAPPPLSDVLTSVRPESEVDEEIPLFGRHQERRLKKTRRIAAVISSFLALVLVAGTVFVLTQRNVQTTVSLGDAVERFRTEATENDGEASRVQEAPRENKRVVNNDPRDPEKVAATTGNDVASVDVLPPQGVYTYRTRGGESVSLFGAKHDYPEQTFATVRHLGGCKWEHRNEVIEEHVDVRHLCGKQGLMTQLMQERRVTFFGTTDGAALDCEPEMLIHEDGEKKRNVTSATCADDDGNESVMKRTFMGTERIKVGRAVVEAVRVDIEGHSTGKAVGASFDSLWLHPETGMTLRWDRTVDTIASAFGAKVRYQEDASFVLASLEPQR